MSNQRSVVEDFPEVLLVEIFACVPATPTGNFYYSTYRARLCGVCKYWNDIIMHHPQFWCKFFFDIPDRQIPLPTLGAWLQRSANMPIEIEIIDTIGEIPVNSRNISIRRYRKEMLSLLSQHLPRWKKLDITMTDVPANLLRNIDFSSAQSLDDVGLSFFRVHPDITRGLLVALEQVPKIHSFKFRQGTSGPDSLTLLRSPGLGFLRGLKRLHIDFDLSVKGMLDVVRRCSEAQWIRAEVKWMTEDPIAMASSEKLRILDLTLSSVDHGTLAHLHVPNLEVLFVRCKAGGGYDVTKAISEFLVGGSRPSLQILRVIDIRLRPVDDLVCNEGLRRIPIMEIRVEVPHNDTNNEFTSRLSEYFDLWKESDDRFRKRMRDDTRSWSVGWVETKAFRQNQESLPADILNEIDIGLLV